MSRTSYDKGDPMLVCITADLHLTSRPLDSYRWDFFRWLEQQKFGTIVILGDLADEKDYHSSVFVNRVVSELTALSEAGREVHILMGNHDYALADSPFFAFIRHCPRCFYHDTPRIWEIANLRWAFYPHSREPEKYQVDMRRGEEVDVDFTLCHQVFHGALSEHGRKLDGWQPGSLRGAGKIFAGDVHVPQIVGPVEYVGAPYPIHFGDSYKPQVTVVDSEERRWYYLHPPSIQKMVLEINDPSQIEMLPGWRAHDQVKVVVKITRSDFGKWEHYRKRVQDICKRNELVLCGIELKERVRARLTTAKVQHVPISYRDQFHRYCQHAEVSRQDQAFGGELLL